MTALFVNAVPGLALLAGALLVGGCWLVVAAFAPRTPHLADTLASLADDADSGARREQVGAGPDGSRSDRLGAWLYRVTPIPLTARQRQQLRVKDTTIAEFFADKLVWAVIGSVLPSVVVTCIGLVGGGLGLVVPVAAAVVGFVLGYFVPDLLLARRADRRRQDAAQALMTYIDLVTLERLANASATQALQHAARVSEVPLFLAIRAALERAQLEQQPPFAELRRLAERMNLPELGDLVDVMQLDEAGASLSTTLRARVRELRDARQATEQRQADAVSEGLTVFMAIPALIFGLIFMAPPLLRLMSS